MVGLCMAPPDRALVLCVEPGGLPDADEKSPDTGARPQPADAVYATAPSRAAHPRHKHHGTTARPGVATDGIVRWRRVGIQARLARLFGIILHERGVGVALVLPDVGTHAMNLHLAGISRSLAPAAHGLVVPDGAGWHRTGKRLRIPAPSACRTCRLVRPS